MHCKSIIIVGLAAGIMYGVSDAAESEMAISIAARSALAAGDTAGAMAGLERDLKYGSKDWAAFLLRGRLRLDRQNWDGAERDFRRALFSRSNVERADAHVGLGDVIIASTDGHLTQGVKEYLLASQVDPTNKPALYKLSVAGFELNDSKGYDLASEALSMLVCLDPDYRGAFRRWYGQFVRHPDSEIRMVTDSLEALALRDTAAVHYNLYVADGRYILHEYNRGFEALERLERGVPGFKPAERELIRARCLLALADTSGFEECYERALDAAGEDGDFKALATDAEPIFTPGEATRWQNVKSAKDGAAFFRTFWKRRDPDPLNPYNERRVNHYSRLAEAKKLYTLSNPHSKFQNSYDYNRLVSILMPDVGGFSPVQRETGPYEYDSDLFFQRSRGTGLDQRGQLYVRHGPPDAIMHPEATMDRSPGAMLDMFSSAGAMVNPVQGATPNKYEIPSQEVWRYGSSYYPFEKVFGAGDYLFVPVYVTGAGKINLAMQSESFSDPVTAFGQDFLGADFRVPGGRVELVMFQSAPLDSIRSENAPFADMALFDTTWAMAAWDTVVAHPLVAAGPDSCWIAGNHVLLDPGIYICALRLDVPARRAVRRKMIALKPYPEKGLELSGVMYGVNSTNRQGIFNRRGVSFDPRPSMRFARQEKIAVYLEMYGLGVDSTGKRGYSERVTVIRDEEKSRLAKLLPFASKTLQHSLAMQFEREPQGASGTVPEHFEIDISDLLDGNYGVTIEVADRATGKKETRGFMFEILADKKPEDWY